MRALSIALITTVYILAVAVAKLHTDFKCFFVTLIITTFAALAINSISNLK